MREVTDILTQAEHGLITRYEARRMLRRLAKQARFNADYSDSPASFNRWNDTAAAALAAADSVPAGPRVLFTPGSMVASQ